MWFHDAKEIEQMSWTQNSLKEIGGAEKNPPGNPQMLSGCIKRPPKIPLFSLWAIWTDNESAITCKDSKLLVSVYLMLSLQMSSAKGLLKCGCLSRMLWELGNLFHCCRKLTGGTKPLCYEKLFYDDGKGSPLFRHPLLLAAGSPVSVHWSQQEHSKDTREWCQHRPLENALEYQLAV